MRLSLIVALLMASLVLGSDNRSVSLSYESPMDLITQLRTQAPQSTMNHPHSGFMATMTSQNLSRWVYIKQLGDRLFIGVDQKSQLNQHIDPQQQIQLTFYLETANPNKVVHIHMQANPEKITQKSEQRLIWMSRPVKLRIQLLNKHQSKAFGRVIQNTDSAYQFNSAIPASQLNQPPIEMETYYELVPNKVSAYFMDYSDGNNYQLSYVSSNMRWSHQMQVIR